MLPLFLCRYLLFHFDHFFLQFAAADQEAADGEQAGDTADAGQVGPGIVMAQHHMAGNCHGQHLQNVGGGGVDQHSYKLQTHHNGQQIVEHMVHFREIAAAGGKHMVKLQGQGADKRNHGNGRNELLHNMQETAEQVLNITVPLHHPLNIGLDLGVVRMMVLMAHGKSSRFLGCYHYTGF